MIPLYLKRPAKICALIYSHSLSSFLNSEHLSVIWSGRPEGVQDFVLLKSSDSINPLCFPPENSGIWKTKASSREPGYFLSSLCQ